MTGGSEWPKLMRSEFGTADRNALIKAGLLRLSKEVPDPESLKRLKPGKDKPKAGGAKPAGKAAGKATGKATGKADGKAEAKTPKPTAINRLYLTDKGKEYLLNHLGDPVSDRSYLSGPVMSHILAALGTDGLGKRAIASLLRISHPPSPPKAAGPAPAKTTFWQPATPEPAAGLTPGILLGEINRLPRRLFMDGGGLRISVLKENLKKYQREAIDASLLALERSGLIALFHFDDPLRVTQADKDLGVSTGGAT
ncbi:MAG: hypothetical protein LBF58_10055, partial [Deltaproteobacteria bacterium]|nr:hypothetical protein [Deltaproteobacteria bacterium]